MTVKVTVIVPVYKVEQYLKRCVDSILKQTVEKIEVILVDDGSPDTCPVICDEIAKKDDRVRVVHKKNGGLASARNAGLTIAKGEYIVFVDSDDWIEPNMLEELLEKANNGNYDFIRFRPVYEGWPGIEDGTLCDFGTESMLKEGGMTKRIYEEKFILICLLHRRSRLGQLLLHGALCIKEVFFWITTCIFRKRSDIQKIQLLVHV